MASVKQRTPGSNWICCYRLPDGSRKQTSSGTTDRQQALLMAMQLESLGTRYTRQAALKMVDEIAATQQQQLYDRTPVVQYLQLWRKARERSWSESTRKSWRAIEKAFCQQYGTLPLGQVDKGHLAQYRDNLMLAGRSPRTIQCHLKYLRMVFDSAIEEGRMHENAARIRLPSPASSPKEPFTLDQFKRLLNHTDGEWHLLILIAGLTGQRLRDCLALQYSDFQDSAIQFRRRKNRDTHLVPLHPSIKSGLPPGFGPLFPELSSLPTTGSRSVSAVFRDSILPRIGIHQPYATSTGGNKHVTRYSFHSLRHMLSTELNRIGTSPETRMLIVGHSTPSVSARYTHASLADAQAAINRIAL